jgi:hypothetical protein
MPGDFYGSFSIPHDELSRQRQLSQLHRRDAAAQEAGASRRPQAPRYANHAQCDYEEAMRSRSIAVLLR